MRKTYYKFIFENGKSFITESRFGGYNVARCEAYIYSMRMYGNFFVKEVQIDTDGKFRTMRIQPQITI